MTDPGTGRTSSPTYHLPPVPREAAHTNDVWLSLSVAVVLGLLAVIIALWPAEQPAKAAVQEVPTRATKEPLPTAAMATAPAEARNSPTRFTNPFDSSEVFEFPPGTSEDAARKSVAEILLERARERGPQITSVKRARATQSPPVRIPRLASKSLFRNASWAASR